MSSTGNTNNDTRKGLTNSLQSFDKESVDFPGSIRYYINNEGALNAPTVLKGHHIMAKSVIVVTDSLNSRPEVFSSIDPALAYVRDLAGDCNPEGSALMVESFEGAPIPASNKNVKAMDARDGLRFTAGSADNAARITALESQLDGAVKACALIGVDPASVAKVQDLGAQLMDLRNASTDAAGGITITLQARPLHARKRKR